ncbi:hypothetical protein EV193_105428 [Herbihabitans rhizosphaerae]|uniref:Tetracyclin repressor-like C-terminal domain-containing protein n=1 Tax=Herbihabitans rhizosphaerae TaxID=1872711 RepID=A0A4Q7KMG2_9PSEU|nr:hypothetical protein [Herbihabitans rhizosphaerae]RZS37868.1 hypothetical protein EV193_105428 [Herbihabitans rhizosphaerae]
MVQRNTAMFELLDGPKPLRDKLKAIFQQLVAEEVVRDPGGCLAVNTMIELSPRDPEVAALLARDTRDRLAALSTAIAAAQRSGEITNDRTPRELTRIMY